jgi:hypothetical protein
VTRCNHSTSRSGRLVAVDRGLNLCGEFYRRRHDLNRRWGRRGGRGFRNGWDESDGGCGDGGDACVKAVSQSRCPCQLPSELRQLPDIP